MRTYPRNSPEAAARIVALVLVSDGHACRSEMDAVDKANAGRELGLGPEAFRDVLRTLCEDLLTGASSGSMLSGVDAEGLRSIMAEVDDEDLQRKVLKLSVAVAAADAHIAEGESVVLEAALRLWRSSSQVRSDLPRVSMMRSPE